MHIDTFDKIKSHNSIGYFEESLKDISGKSHGNVSPKYIREWLRLCFFANDCKTITEYIGPKPKNCYYLDFETFFSSDGIKQSSLDILRHFDFEISIAEIDDVIEEFFSKQRYKNHINTDSLKNSIQKNHDIPLNLNIVEQAWLDNWLVEQYSVDPILTDEYFNSTKELIDSYAKVFEGKI